VKTICDVCKISGHGASETEMCADVARLGERALVDSEVDHANEYFATLSFAYSCRRRLRFECHGVQGL